MPSTNSMTREDLLEYAALDAFGFLDEYEAALYTRSFHNAPAAVQDQIIQLQAQLVSDESLLPADNPTPELRERVLTAVNNAIEHETAQLEPLATIGRPRPTAEITGSFRLSAYGQFWRAAAFSLAAALIVVLYFFAQLSREHYNVARIALYNNTQAQLEEQIGPTFKDILFREHTAVSFAVSGTHADPQPKASLAYTEDGSLGMLVIENLPAATRPYVLTMIDANGQSHVIEQFDSTGKLGGIRLALDHVASRIADARWEISGPGGIVLASI